MTQHLPQTISVTQLFFDYFIKSILVAFGQRRQCRPNTTIPGPALLPITSSQTETLRSFGSYFPAAGPHWALDWSVGLGQNFYCSRCPSNIPPITGPRAGGQSNNSPKLNISLLWMLGKRNRSRCLPNPRDWFPIDPGTSTLLRPLFVALAARCYFLIDREDSVYTLSQDAPRTLSCSFWVCLHRKLDCCSCDGHILASAAPARPCPCWACAAYASNALPFVFGYPGWVGHTGRHLSPLSPHNALANHKSPPN